MDGLLLGVFTIVVMILIWQINQGTKQTRNAIEEVRLSLNHRLSEWRDETRATAVDTAKAAHQAGVAQGEEAERQRRRAPEGT